MDDELISEVKIVILLISFVLKLLVIIINQKILFGLEFFFPNRIQNTVCQPSD